jgi:hypothetical protein
MASIREIARSVADEIREGICWVIVSRVGRSWDYETIWLDAETDVIDTDDMELIKEILLKDPHAVALNGYYCGHFWEEMSASDVANGMCWHYANRFNLLKDFVEEHAPTESINTQDAG